MTLQATEQGRTTWRNGVGIYLSVTPAVGASWWATDA